MIAYDAPLGGLGGRWWRRKAISLEKRTYRFMCELMLPFWASDAGRRGPNAFFCFPIS